MLQGFAYMLEGFKLIWKPGYRLFLLVPILANIALFALLIMWAKTLFSDGMGFLMGWIPDWLWFLEWIFWLIYFIAILMVIFYTFVAAANLLGAPFYGYLAERLEQDLSGHAKDEPFSWATLIKLIPRTVKRELQKLLYYLPRVIALLILGFIPGLNAIVAVVWIIFSAWMMAVQYIDYPADNNGMSFPDLRKYLKTHRWAALGFGAMAFGLTLIPILNLLALPAAVCGAVAFWVNQGARNNPWLVKQSEQTEINILD
jgi:CysZ protein